MKYEEPKELPETELIDLRHLTRVLRILGEKCPDFTQREYLIVATLIATVETGTGSIAEHDIDAARAMLLHMILMRDCKLSARAVAQAPDFQGQGFLNQFAERCLGILTSPVWQDAIVSMSATCDLYDLLDGRMFLTLWSNMDHQDKIHKASSSIWPMFEELCLILKDHFGFGEKSHAFICNEVSRKKAGPTDESIAETKPQQVEKLQETFSVDVRILPFSNPVFDIHLQPLRLCIDEPAGELAAARASRMFEELSHWHNSRRPVDHKADAAMTARLTVLARRRNDIFRTEMRDYAASLNNVDGGVLEPESVFVTTSKVQKKATTRIAKSTNSAARAPRSAQKSGLKSTQLSVREAAALLTQEKRGEAREKQIKQWNLKRGEFDKENDLMCRYVKVKRYCSSIPKDKRSPAEAEILAYQLDTLVRILLTNVKNQEKNFRMTILTFIWEAIWKISKLQDSITVDIAGCINGVANTFGLPDVNLQARSDQKLSFDFVQLPPKVSSLGNSLSPLEFQLTYAGPFMDRTMDSRPDSRVQGFEPDRWQRDVLDQIDAKNSVFVVAPTSAGKTFIS